MTNVYELVKEFHTAFNVVVRTEPQVDVPEAGLRFEMMKSEMIELFTAAFKGDEVEIADGLADIAYIAEGGALIFGLGPVELVKYEKAELGNMSLYLHHTFLLLPAAIQSGDPDYVRAILSIVKSACYYLAEQKGYDLSEVIEVVHKSNMTKLGEDGKPVYILEGPEKGKITKGPNYVPPTEDIKEILSRRITGDQS